MQYHMERADTDTTIVTLHGDPFFVETCNCLSMDSMSDDVPRCDVIMLWLHIQVRSSQWYSGNVPSVTFCFGMLFSMPGILSIHLKQLNDQRLRCPKLSFLVWVRAFGS